MAVLVRQRYRRQLSRLIEDWVEYRGLAALESGGNSDANRKLLLVKGRIAEGLTRVFERIPQQRAHDAASQRKGILDLLNQRLPVENERSEDDGAPPPPSPSRSDFDKRWEQGFLFLNQLKGITPVSGSSRAFAPVRPASGGGRGGRFQAFLNHWLIRFVLVIAILVLAVAALARILPWDRMGFAQRPELGSLRDAAGNAVEGLGKGSSGILGGLFGPLRRLADPVFQQYGTEVSILMFTVLLLGIGYLVFIRSR